MINQQDLPDTELGLWSAMAKTAVIALALVLFFCLITLSSLAFFAFANLTKATNAANTTPGELYSTLRTNWNHSLLSSNNKVIVLILGVDAISNRTGDPLLTDTILLASLDLGTGKLNLLSIPRDVWSPEYQTKINSLYFYGQEKYPETPEKFTGEYISQITQLPIHHTLALSLDQVSQIIDALGGVQVTVNEGFTDQEFPRSDVDIKTVTDPALLYETVSFEAGDQVLSGERALKYIRSRHSSGEQGTDDARSVRQQQVVEAIAKKALQKETVINPTMVGTLFSFYQIHFSDNFPLHQIIAIAKTLFANRNMLSFSIEKSSLSITSDGFDGVLTHPPLIQTQNQWAYIISDPVAFKDEVWQKLHY